MGRNSKDKKRRNSSDNYTSQSKTAKHGGKNDSELNCSVSDTIKEANQVLFNDPTSSLDNSVFLPGDSTCVQAWPTLQQIDCPHVNDKENDQSQSHEILMYLKKMDAKITTLDNKLSKLDNLESEMVKLGTEMTKLWNFIHDNVKDSNMKLT